MENEEVLDIEKIAEEAIIDENNAIENPDDMGFDGVEGCED